MIEEGLNPNKPEPIEIYRRIVDDDQVGVFVPNPDKARLVNTLTLLTHGTKPEFFLGDEQSVGILNHHLTRDDYRLCSRMESHVLGADLPGYLTKATDASESEEGVSFYAGQLSDISTVFFVMPLSTATQNGVLLSSFTSPSQLTTPNQLGGMHAITGEIDIYSPMGFSLSQLKRFRLIANEANVEKLLHPQFSTELREFGLVRAGEVDSDVLFNEELRNQRIDEFNKRLENLRELSKEFWGVDLYNPLTLLLVPTNLEKKVTDVLSRIPDVQLREVISNQIEYYEDVIDVEYDPLDDEYNDEGSPVHENFERYKDIEFYATKVLPNLRIWMQDPDLSLEVAMETLKIQETLLDGVRFHRGLGPGYLYPPSVGIKYIVDLARKNLESRGAQLS